MTGKIVRLHAVFTAYGPEHESANSMVSQAERATGQHLQHQGMRDQAGLVVTH